MSRCCRDLSETEGTCRRVSLPNMHELTRNPESCQQRRITAGNFYPVNLRPLFIQSLPSHTSLELQMSSLIQRMKAITPGNRFLVVVLEGGLLPPERSALVHTHQQAEVCSPEECSACVKLGVTVTEPGGRFCPSLRLSLLFTSHHPSQWAL